MFAGVEAMGAITKSLDSVIKAAGKTIGGSFDPPKSLNAVIKSLDQGSKPYDDLMNAVKGLDGILGQIDKLSGNILGLIAKAQTDLAKEDFGLDPKKPDDKKKIDAVVKQLSAFLNDAAKDIEKQTTSFSKLTDVVASAGKSKGLA